MVQRLSMDMLHMRNHPDHEIAMFSREDQPVQINGNAYTGRVVLGGCQDSIHREGIKRPTEKRNPRVAEAHRVPGDVGCNYIPIRC
jgi:hypothetical protein